MAEGQRLLLCIFEKGRPFLGTARTRIMGFVLREVIGVLLDSDLRVYGFGLRVKLS